MASENRETDSPLIDELLREGPRYEFYQAVRLLQEQHPGCAKLGYQGPVEQEVIRIFPTADLGFPPSDVAQVRPLLGPDGVTRYEIQTTFLSLLGSQSPLPVYFSENVLQDDSDESLVKEFLDLFHHRLHSLVYRSWEKYRIPIQFESAGGDFYSRRFLALVGLGSGTVPPNFRVSPLRLLAYAGLLTQVPHSASSLESILNDYLPGVDARIEECSAQWIPIEPQQHNRLGSRNSSLGQDLTIGERVFDRSCTFTISMGPLDLATFMTYLPPGKQLAELDEIVDLFNNDCLDYYVGLWIRREEIPELKLGHPHALLGWTTWVGRRPDEDQSVRFLMKGWHHGRS